MNSERFSTILDMLEQPGDSEKLALICGEEKLTYRQLREDAKQIARKLAARGIKKGDRVLFCMRSTADAFRALFGILYAGGVYVAADPDWPQERLQFVERDGETVFSMTEETLRELRKGEEADRLLPKVRPEDAAAVYYTSGSTGQPKGVVLYQGVFAQAMPHEHDPAPKWTVAQIIFKLSFVASIMDSCYIFTRGNTVLMATDQERGSVDLLARAMERHQVDCMPASASIFLRYLENPAFARVFARLRFVSLGAERVDPSVAARLSAATESDIWIHYASSEMFFCAEYLYRKDGQVHVGKPGHGVRLYLLNDQMEEILPGEKGELFIGGLAAKYNHYLNRPELDEEKFVEHPRYGRLFCTGDLGRLETDGEISIVGRMDRMVKLHGQRIEIAEIENQMESFGEIRRVAVRLLGESPHEMLAGYYTSSEDVSETELRRYLADHLPYYMVPSLFMRLEAMPENANGKLDYRALPPIPLPKQEYEPPQTKREKLLCEIFAQVLKVSAPVSVNANFLALGGDSISGMAVGSLLLEHGLSLEVRYLFTAPTARLLAPLLVPLEEEGEAQERGAVLIEPTPGQREAIERSVGWEKVECVYPVSRVVSEKLDERASYLVYGMWEIKEPALSPEEFKRRVAEVCAAHQALRSVFCLAEGEEHLQVVQRESRPECFYTDLRALAEGEELSSRQKAYFRNLIQLDLLHPRDLEREVLFKAGLVRVSETRSILFLAFSHLLLDGTGSRLIVDEFAGRVKIQPDRKLWTRRILRVYHRDDSESLGYWRRLLEGCQGFTKIPMKEGGTGELSPNSFYAAGGKSLYEKLVCYCRTHWTTVSAVIHYAFARALMELLKTEEVCFISEGSGRTAEDARLAGMFVLHFPVRLRRRDTLQDCQAQLISSAAHFEVLGIRKADPTAGWGKCYGVLNVQNILEDADAPRQILGSSTLAESFEQTRSLEKQALMTHREEDRWFLRVSLEEQLAFSCSAVFNAGRYDAELIKELSREFIRQLRLTVKEDA